VDFLRGALPAFAPYDPIVIDSREPRDFRTAPRFAIRLLVRWTNTSAGTSNPLSLSTIFTTSYTLVRSRIYMNVDPVQKIVVWTPLFSFSPMIDPPPGAEGLEHLPLLQIGVGLFGV